VGYDCNFEWYFKHTSKEKVSDSFISYTKIFISLTFTANTMLSHDEVTGTSDLLITYIH